LAWRVFFVVKLYACEEKSRPMRNRKRGLIGGAQWRSKGGIGLIRVPLGSWMARA
jgi:hypothetical protein